MAIDQTKLQALLARAVVDIFFEKIFDAEAHGVGEQHFRDLLHGAGLFDREPRTQNEGENRTENDDNYSHHDVFGNGLFRIARLNVESGK